MSDYIVHASGAGNQVRIFAASTRDLVEKAREIHNTSPVATAALGRLLTAGAMMGSMMKGEKDLLTLQIQCSGPIGGLTVTAKSDGTVKGYVNNPDVMLPPNSKGKLDVGGALDLGVLSVGYGYERAICWADAACIRRDRGRSHLLLCDQRADQFKCGSGCFDGEE